MKKLLIISISIIFVALSYQCTKEEDSISVKPNNAEIEKLKKDFNLKEINGSINVPISMSFNTIEEARAYLSKLHLRVFASNVSMKPSKLKGGGGGPEGSTSTTVQGTANRSGDIVTCSASSGMGTSFNVTGDIYSTSDISSNFSGFPTSILITNYQQQAKGSYNSSTGIYTANISGYYTYGFDIQGNGVYSTYNYTVTMTYNTGNNSCYMSGSSW